MKKAHHATISLNQLTNAMNTTVVHLDLRARLAHLAKLGRKRVERAALRFSQAIAAPAIFSPRMKEPALETGF